MSIAELPDEYMKRALELFKNYKRGLIGNSTYLLAWVSANALRNEDRRTISYLHKVFKEWLEEKKEELDECKIKFGNFLLKQLEMVQRENDELKLVASKGTTTVNSDYHYQSKTTEKLNFK